MLLCRYQFLIQGKLVAVGDSEGVVTVIELCDSLNILQPKEKEVITEVIIF